MKRLAKLTIGILLFGLTIVSSRAAVPSQAAFSSLYVFGDSLSATADGTTSPLYYPGRDSNGRAWVEVLAQRQGLTFDGSKNDSYYDHSSTETLADIALMLTNRPNSYANSLVVLWVCNADTFDAAQVPDNTLGWTLATTSSQTNHLAIITALYLKGVRTLIMPNAVDISEIPAFNAGTTLTNVEHNGCVAYNTGLSNTIIQARLSCPGLTIYTPDFYTLLNKVLTNASYYGLTNALSAKGYSIDAVTALYSNPKLPVYLNGPGTNYIFWDQQDPTAALHEIMADTVQQIISPVQIGKLTPLNNGSNRLDVVNYPAGLGGFVDGSTNLPNWTTVQNITSTNIADSFFAPTNGSPNLPQLSPDVNINPIGGSGSNGVPLVVTAQFYRLRFPYSWTWP